MECHLCGKRFKGRLQFSDHINIHLGIRPFRCNKCNKCYNNRGAYHNHMRIHGDERLYVCPLCKSDFLWEASLKWHLNVHKKKGEITAQMVRQMYERTINVVRLKKKQLKFAAQQKKENHISYPKKQKNLPNHLPYNCYKQQGTINKYDYGEKNRINYELLRRNAIRNSHDYENTENDKYWMDKANAMHTNTEECFSQLENGSTNSKYILHILYHLKQMTYLNFWYISLHSLILEQINSNAANYYRLNPIQEGTNYLYQNHYAHPFITTKEHDQSNTAAPANKSLYNATTEQFNYEGENFLSINGTDNQERYLKPGGHYSIQQFDENDCFFESTNQNECSELPAKVNRHISSLVGKDSEEKDLLGLAMEVLYETVPRETNCEEKENFPIVDNANNIKCSEKDWGNHIIQQSVETNCRFERYALFFILFYKISQKNENMDITNQNGFNAEIQRCHNTSLINKQENKGWITSAMEVLYGIKPEDYKVNTNFANTATIDNDESIHEISEYYKTPKQETENHFQNFHEQPNGSLYLNEEFQTEYSPNFLRIYENNMTKEFHQIPPNMTTEQQFIPQQLFHNTFAEQYNLQNANAPCSITNHTLNANYGYYQQNSPQGTFNQQFIPQPEEIIIILGYPYHQNNLQAVYANETVYPLSNYAQPQISDGSTEKDIEATNYQKRNGGTGIHDEENHEMENAVFHYQGFEGNDDVSTYGNVQTKLLETEQKHIHQSNSTLDQVNARDETLEQNSASAKCDTILDNADFQSCMKQWMAGKGINYKILRTLNIDGLQNKNGTTTKQQNDYLPRKRKRLSLNNDIENTQQYVERFYEQPNGSLHTNEIYENNMANYIQEISPNTSSQQQFIPEQPFHYTFDELNNFQNVNTLGTINDHAYYANYGYYQQNLPQETFNQQFIPQSEGNPYHENNLQAVYANETVDPLSNYWQLQISSPQGTFNEQFIPQPEGNPYHENNLQAVYANETVDPLSNYWQLQISSPQGTFNEQFIPQPEGNPNHQNNLQNEDVIDSIPNDVHCLLRYVE
ncbi:Zinc finger protein [Trichinella zimbabwensis]|uniref:Zinc finger protein n=1 Tax=Trichinella zimbabwensis TaxID=268475 RepID=A0A0V1HWP3_9BILA|nr:Zinc finger protein [Trichinella zimbabwensis]